VKYAGDYVAIFGERYRRLIENAVGFLDAQEASWGLSEQLDRDAFLEDLIDRADPQRRGEPFPRPT
jgi:hypothetical protein